MSRSSTRAHVFTCLLLTRDADDKRHSGRHLPVGALVPRAVLAQLVPVVAPKDDDGVLAEVEAIELGENAADLGIRVADAGVVAVDGFALHALWDRALFRDALVAANSPASLLANAGCRPAAAGIRRDGYRRHGTCPYRFGGTQGMWGLWKPTARKNGLSLISFITLTALSAIWPSSSPLSATSGDW